MNIASVEAIPIEMPLSKVFSGSGYRVAGRDRKRLMEAIACVDTALWDLFDKYRLDR
jgi:L-alanine-DL-glutamate epimerase-like enolase superfamily enzyme